MKVGRVAIITRGRYAGKKVRPQRLFPAIEMHIELCFCEDIGRKSSDGRN